ncbi:MAG: hypothetical protein GXP31_06525 [Kiritimatiellaeota bacterium]|nr:hypothetical protein [Kiritimatiellota bacterium]
MQQHGVRLQAPKRAAALVAALFLAGTAHRCTAEAGPAPSVDALGRTVKLRILVDKVMLPTEGWVSKEWMVKATAEAGFNVFCPRTGFDRPAEVRQVADWCARYGIFYMPWMRGTLTAPMDETAAGRRMVWDTGVEQPLWSPNSDEFWEWTTRHIVAYAKLSRENPVVLGVFLDYENYAPGRPANAYSLSYDDRILEQFADKSGVAIPKLPFSERRKWLEKRRLHDDFAAFQVAHWRARCQALRKAVDQYNPKFRFCVYPAPGTPFMQQAIYPEWATKSAPLILADACTYGRPSAFTPMGEALARNRQLLAERMEVPRKAGIPFIYTGGIDPVVRGADPEFSGKNAVMISELTDGYWIFYEGPKFDDDHPRYWEWFTRANRAIAAGNFSLWRQLPEEPDFWFNRLFGRRFANLPLVSPPAPQQSIQFKPVKFRGMHLLLLPMVKGQTAHVALRHHPVGRYESILRWTFRNPAGSELSRGEIPQGKTGTVNLEAPETGLFLLGVDAGPCAWSVAAADVAVGVVAVERIHLIGGPFRLYFRPPPNIRQFTIGFAGSGAETIRVRLRRPDGEIAAEAQTSIRKNRSKVTGKTSPDSQGTWCIETARADEGVIEDNTLRLDPKLVPVLSLAPEQVFGIRTDSK